MTGNGKPLPPIDDKGHFDRTGLESYSSSYEYSDKNLLLHESNVDGLDVFYTYLGATDLVTEKKTYAHKNQWVKTETFTYNQDHCLTESAEYDGIRKTIIRINPSQRPFGYPETKEIYGWTEEAGEVFLGSFHYTYNLRGQITSKEKKDGNNNRLYLIKRTYDSHGNCTFETNAVGDSISREFDLNDNCIKEAGPRVGFVKHFRFNKMNQCSYEGVFLDEKVISERKYGYTRLRSP